MRSAGMVKSPKKVSSITPKRSPITAAVFIVLLLWLSTVPLLSSGAAFAAERTSTEKPWVHGRQVQAAQYLAVAVTNEETVHSPVELEQRIIEKLYARESHFTMRYMSDTANLDDLLNGIINGIIREDDYLRYSIKGWQWRWAGFAGDVHIHFRIEHLISQEEEKYIDSKVEAILRKIFSPGMDDHLKVKAVHDYIVSNVAYDTKMEEFTPYGALTKGRAVCQGYSLLAYKMLQKAGIPVRIISGRAGGEAHAWNLVKLDGHWYHLDCTWNDPVPDVPGRVLYDYYNRTDAEMATTHYWDSSAYPSCNTPYRSPEGVKLQSYMPDTFHGFRMPPKYDQPADKKWAVNFNVPLDTSTLNNNNIYVIDARGNDTAVTVVPGPDMKSAVIIPLNNYLSGRTYYLFIGGDIVSQAGIKMQGLYWMEFTIS